MSPEAWKEPPLSPEGFRARLSAALPAFGLELADGSRRALATFLSELDLWRRKTNLTGHLSAGELTAHALESVRATDLINHGERLVDVGSGAGFPGFPIAIARPDLAVTLVEPRRKKCVFLRHAVRAVGLSNVEVFEGRVQEVGGQTFQVVTTRALGEVASWMDRATLLTTGGRLLAWTADRETLAASLDRAFEAAGSVRIPGSQRREIAAFRKR